MGTYGDNVFIAMEFVVGEEAAQWLPTHRAKRREMLRVFLEAGRGLSAAHKAGLVHRDFKPDNVLVADDARPGYRLWPGPAGRREAGGQPGGRDADGAHRASEVKQDGPISKLKAWLRSEHL